MTIQLLKEHLEKYPLMEPRDAVKLAYQHAFGCGHMLPDQDICRRMIRQEMDSIPEDASVPVSGPIGCGLCRLHLAAPAVRRLGALQIARMMRATEMQVMHRKSNELLYSGALSCVRAAIHKGWTSFSIEQWDAFLAWHREEGRPVVSHSEAYRQAYRPHYRVVLESFAALMPVVEKLRDGKNLIVLDGPCGSGKTTLGKVLAGMEWHDPIPMDDFFLPFEMRTPERLSQPGGNVHHERFLTEVLAHLDDGLIGYRRFDCATGTMVPKQVRADDVCVIEGSYSHHPAFDAVYRERGALRVYVDVDEEEQLRRLAKRAPELLERFRNEWIPLEKRYFEAYDIKKRADVVIRCENPLKEDDD